MRDKRVIMKTITYKWLFYLNFCSLGAAGTPSVLLCVN